MSFQNLFYTIPVALFLGCSLAKSATLIHDYRFEGNLTDSLGGPSLISEGGIIIPKTTRLPIHRVLP